MADSASEQLRAFLARALPGTGLPGLGYGERPFLRFELGGGIPVQSAEKRVEQATERAALIFESAFGESDEGFLSFTRWRGEEDDIVLPMLRAGAAGSIDRTDGNDFYEEGEDSPFVTFTAALRPGTLAYRGLFRATASADLGLAPAVDGAVYLVNAVRPLVFHMYDDRGAMLIAPDAATLMPLYEQFGAWLVEAWRSKIEAKLGLVDR